MKRETLRIVLDIFVIIAITVAVGILITFLMVVLKDGGQCVANPAGYYAKVNNISNICESCKNSFGFSITP